jgi:hypothetical protein
MKPKPAATSAAGNMDQEALVKLITDRVLAAIQA